MSVIDVNTNGFGRVSVEVSDQGEGRVVVLLHGGAGPVSMAPFGARLAAERAARVIMPTHPGFDGTSLVEAVSNVRELAGVYVDLLDTLELDDITVVGNSLGGWLALEIALMDCPRVARVMVCDAVGIDVPAHPIADFFDLPFAQVQDLSFHDPAAFRLDPNALPPEAQQIMAGNRTALEHYAGRAMVDSSLCGRIRGIRCPVLVAWGDSDGIADPDYGRALAEAIPGTRFTLFPDTGHLPQLERPDLMLTALWEFAEPTVWTAVFELQTDVSLADMWAALRALETGQVAMSSGDGRHLEGRFERGATILATPAGLGRTLHSTVLELEPGRKLAVKTLFGDLDLLLRHTLEPLDDGGTRITRQLEISGPGAAQQGPLTGPRIAADYNDALNEIESTARALSVLE